MTAVLNLTDGTTSVSLVSQTKYGFHLLDWKPAIAGFKNDGTYQDSPLSDGKRLVSGYYDNVHESFTVSLAGTSQNDAIERMRTLLRLLKKASDYWLDKPNTTPVWLEVKADKETNARYAIVVRGIVANEDNPFGMPFIQPDCNAVMDGLSLTVERGHWCALPPGTSTCQYIDTAQVQDNGFTMLAAADFTDHAVVEGVTLSATGTIYSIDYSNKVYSCANNGITWALKSTTATTTISTVSYDNYMRTIAAAPNGDMYIGGYIVRTGGAGGANDGACIWKSTNGGATITRTDNVPDATQGYPWKIIVVSNTVIIAFIALTNAGTTIVRKTTNGGTNWSTVYTFATPLFSTAILLSNGRIVASFNTTTTTRPYYSDDYGITWTQVSTGIPFGHLIEWTTQGAGVVIGSAGGNFYISSDYGLTWSLLSTPGGVGSPAAMIAGPNGKIYVFSEGGGVSGQAGASSSADGITWTSELAISGLTGYWLLADAATTDVLLACDHDVYHLSYQVNTGHARACSGHYVANKSNEAQVTHAYAYDASGTSFASVFPASSLPVSLYPASPVSGDMLYIGSTIGPFCSVVFNLATAMMPGYETITWEYYNTGWAALPVQDNTSNFTSLGVRSVNWAQPNDWAANAINGITAFWVRARISAGSPVTSPTQQTENVYSVLWPYVNIDHADVNGDITALEELELTVQSDRDGVGANAPDLYANRVICGLRSVDRGENFCAFLNASNVQLPPMVGVVAGTHCTFTAAKPECITGKELIFDPTAANEAMADRVKWTLATTVARDYYGTFHAFMRGQQTAVTVGNVAVRLVITTGSGGVSWTSETKYFTTLNAYQLIDFGRITLPVSGLLSDEIADQTTLAIQASATSASDYLYIHDLILIPTDEWAGDFTDGVNTASSTLINGKIIEIDSVTNPKKSITAKVKSSTSGLVSAIWSATANGPLALQPNTTQRLWFLTARTAAVGALTNLTDWRSEPYVCHSVQLYKNERYLSARGTR